MGETTNSKINSKTKPVYFNLDDEDELKLYKKACKMNFSKWVKKQLSGDNKARKIETEKVVFDDINREMQVMKNKEIDSMMI